MNTMFRIVKYALVIFLIFIILGFRNFIEYAYMDHVNKFPQLRYDFYESHISIGEIGASSPIIFDKKTGIMYSFNNNQWIKSDPIGNG